MRSRAIVAVVLVVASSPALAFDPQPGHAFAAGATYQTCFTPGQDCQGLIVAEIQAARSAILLQAYSFTSKPIAAALSDAKHRSVDLRAVLDKIQRTERY